MTCTIARQLSQLNSSLFKICLDYVDYLTCIKIRAVYTKIRAALGALF